MTRYTPLWEQQGTYAASLDRRLPGALWPTGAATGGLVTPATAMTVNIAAGMVAIPIANGTGSVLCVWDAVEQVTLNAAPGAGLNRLDLVVATARGNDFDGGANNDWIFQAIAGTAAASPTPPAVPTNSVAVAQILVPALSASVSAGNIYDVRPGALAPISPPAALAPTAAFASFTDAGGTVWVAKGGVNGGLWRRARDVLHARVWRSAALTIGSPSTAFPFDTVTRDPFGMWNTPGLAFFVPIGGLWSVTSLVSGTPTAAFQGFSSSVWVSGVQIAQGTIAHNVAAYPYATSIATDVTPTTGQWVQIQTLTSSGNLTIAPNSNLCYYCLDYLGTG